MSIAYLLLGSVVSGVVTAFVIVILALVLDWFGERRERRRRGAENYKMYSRV